MGKRITLRLNNENEIKFQKLCQISRMDNMNRAFNWTIERAYDYVENEGLIKTLKQLKVYLKDG